MSKTFKLIFRCEKGHSQTITYGPGFSRDQIEVFARLLCGGMVVGKVLPAMSGCAWSADIKLVPDATCGAKIGYWIEEEGDDNTPTSVTLTKEQFEDLVSNSRPPPPPVDHSAKTTLHGMDPNGPEHREIDPATGMQKDYVVLTAEERAKGFVRPVRRTYRHVGKRPKYATRDLTPEEQELYNKDSDEPYVKFEVFPPEMAPRRGRFWTAAELNSGCGMITTMGTALAETYARSPSFYSGTFCATCRAHSDVGPEGEFVWAGTDEKVGT